MGRMNLNIPFDLVAFCIIEMHSFIQLTSFLWLSAFSPDGGSSAMFATFSSNNLMNA